MPWMGMAAGQSCCIPAGSWQSPSRGEEGAEMRRKFPNCFQGKKLLLRKKCLEGWDMAGMGAEAWGQAGLAVSVL